MWWNCSKLRKTYSGQIQLSSRLSHNGLSQTRVAMTISKPDIDCKKSQQEKKIKVIDGEKNGGENGKKGWNEID